MNKNGRCRGEAGTFAATRPDVSTQARLRKEQKVRMGAAEIRDSGHRVALKIVPSCLFCLRRLKRYHDAAKADADCTVVELAEHLLREDWLPIQVKSANSGGMERVL